MSCNQCGSKRIASISAKCSDCCVLETGGNEHVGYVKEDMGIGGDYGDYVRFEWCLNCGQIQGVPGQFPLPLCELEEASSQAEED